MASLNADQKTLNSSVAGSNESRILRDELSRPSPNPLRLAAPVEFLSTVSFTELPEKEISSVEIGITTPNVLNRERIKFQNTGAVTVTNFLDGQEGQEITIKGDGFTTITHGSLIKTSTGANKLLSATKVYRFVRFGGVWIEQDATASAPTNIRTASFYAAQVTHTVSGTSDWFPNNVNKYPIAGNFTAVTGYRIVTVAEGNGGNYTITPTMHYSSDGLAWTADTSLASASYTNAVPTIKISASSTFPAGAQLNPSYLAVKIAVSGTVIIYSISIELT